MTPCSTTSQTPPEAVPRTGTPDSIGLEWDQSEAPRVHWAETRGRQGEDAFDSFVIPHIGNLVADAQLPGDAGGRDALGSVADHDQAGVDAFEDFLEGPHDIGNALDRPEVADVHDDLLVIGSQVPAVRPGRIEAVEVHEIVDGMDGFREIERFLGFVGQPVRDGGDAATAFHGKPGEVEIRGVASDKGDVGAVQCGDDVELLFLGIISRAMTAQAA